MREIRQSGSEGGARLIPCPYPYHSLSFIVDAWRFLCERIYSHRL